MIVQTRAAYHRVINRKVNTLFPTLQIFSQLSTNRKFFQGSRGRSTNLTHLTRLSLRTYTGLLD